jgi:radical SAM superfamily enzyme
MQLQCLELVHPLVLVRRTHLERFLAKLGKVLELSQREYIALGMYAINHTGFEMENKIEDETEEQECESRIRARREF